MLLLHPPLLSTEGLWQRWASTLANRSNARHRSNIRAPPPPRPLPPDVCTQIVGICVARWAGSDSQLAWVSGCHIIVPAPHAPPPRVEVKGRKSSFCPPLAYGQVFNDDRSLTRGMRSVRRPGSFSVNLTLEKTGEWRHEVRPEVRICLCISHLWKDPGHGVCPEVMVQPQYSSPLERLWTWDLS